MKKQHLFTLDIPLVQRLHRKVARGLRSQFVEKAIKDRLDGQSNFDLNSVDTNLLATVLMNRIQADNNWEHTALSLMIREWLK